MAQYAITYAPNYSPGSPPLNTTQTGSFYIGNLLSGVRAWNDVVPQTTTNTEFFASPIANVNNASPYIFAIPNPLQPAPYLGIDQPQFFYSGLLGNNLLTDPAFTATAEWLLKNYSSTGYPIDYAGGPYSPANPGGCSPAVDPLNPTVAECQSAIDAVGWFQSYGFIPPP